MSNHPRIDSTSFGEISIDGARYQYDVVIRPDGEVVKRKKKLSKEVYGTSHVISEAEARFLLEDAGRMLILGTGQYGQVTLSPEAARLFEEKEVEVMDAPTPKAIQLYNQADGKCSAMFHVTC